MKTFFTLFLCSVQFILHSQNLVPNWSFETITSCLLPSGSIIGGYVPPWFSPSIDFPSITDSPDAFNQCAPWAYSTPANSWGWQLPSTGLGYSGCICSGSSDREYIEVPLTTSLIAGKKYCVEFYVSPADSSKLIIDGFGAYLTTDSVLASNAQPLPYSPQVANLSGNVINDTSVWTLISGSFIAVGGEKFITIGNFKTDLATIIDTMNYGYLESYYYFDDVSVYECDSVIAVENNLFVPTAFSPNGDGNNDFLFVRGQNIKDLHFSVYDRWGEKVFETNDINVGWDGTFNEEKMESAVFAYYITLTYLDGKAEAKKGNVSLIR